MSHMMNIDSDAFDTFIKQHEIVFLDFWAPWCAPCQAFKKTYEKVAKAYPQICFAQINIEASPALSESLEIRSIPFLMVIKHEIVIYAESGSMPLARLKELADQALTVTID